MTEPLFQVVRGNPDPAELAALTVVVLAAAAGGPDSDDAHATAWSSRTGQIRRPIDHGPGAWRVSGLPHTG